MPTYFSCFIRDWASAEGPFWEGGRFAKAKVTILLLEVFKSGNKGTERSEMYKRTLQLLKKMPHLGNFPFLSCVYLLVPSFTESQNPSMAGGGRDLCGSPSPTPCPSRVTQSRLHRTLSRWVWNISREGDSTTSLVLGLHLLRRDCFWFGYLPSTPPSCPFCPVPHLCKSTRPGDKWRVKEQGKEWGESA